MHDPDSAENCGVRSWGGRRARRCATTGARFGPDSAETVEIPQLSTEQLVFAEVQLCAPSASGKPSMTKSSSSSRAGGWR